MHLSQLLDAEAGSVVDDIEVNSMALDRGTWTTTLLSVSCNLAMYQSRAAPAEAALALRQSYWAQIS